MYTLLNGAFWDMEQVHSGICELGQLDRYPIEEQSKTMPILFWTFLGENTRQFCW